VFINRHAGNANTRSSDPEMDGASRCLACNAPMLEDEERCEHCGWSFADGAEVEEPDPE